MSEKLSHDGIAQRFLESGSLNFDAMGKFVTEIGPELVQFDKGVHGVVFGKYNLLACMMPAWDLASVVGSLQRAREVAEEMTPEGPR